MAARDDKERRGKSARSKRQKAGFVRRGFAPRPPLDREVGLVHDLPAILAEVRRDYFDGQYAGTTIRWGRALSKGQPRAHKTLRYGFCVVEDREIVIHRALDRPFVPRCFVAYIVFHEILHLKHQPECVNGRRLFHTRAFFNEEASFAYHGQMVRWEQRHLRRLCRY